jgi:glycerol-3-phosphate O-acyltransferase
LNTEITISVWLFLILAAISIFWVLERVLIPGTRWFLRRKINRAIDEINTRLDIRIKPFQLTKRQVLIDRLAYDPEVMEALEEKARRENIPREVVQNEIIGYAREIVPSFNAYLYFRIGYWLAKKVARLLYWVRIGLMDSDAFDEVDPDAAVVFVMNHRSNMDYILVSFLAAEKTTLSYAVGEWAKVWPLQTLIRALGAYFVRRKSGNPLYRRVLQRYIQMATKEGVCQAVFPEGGLSRDGKINPPKLGVFDYMLRNFDPAADRDIVFIPVGINYDRALEDRSLLHELDPEAAKRSSWFVIRTTAGFVWRSLVLMALSRWQKFGYACVSFGNHLSARNYCNARNLNFAMMGRAERFGAVEELANQLVADIEKLVPILPVPLVAAVMLNCRERWLSAIEVESAARKYIERLEQEQAPVYIPDDNRVESILYALETLTLRRFVEQSEGCYRAAAENIEVLQYYANSLQHWGLSHEN